MKKKQTQKAVALLYKHGQEPAPRVTAKGSGWVAERIIDAARAHGIPVKEDPDLLTVLSKLDIEEEIPAGVYIVVAELLAFVYSMNRKKEPG